MPLSALYLALRPICRGSLSTCAVYMKIPDERCRQPCGFVRLLRLCTRHVPVQCRGSCRLCASENQPMGGGSVGAHDIRDIRAAQLGHRRTRSHEDETDSLGASAGAGGSETGHAHHTGDSLRVPAKRRDDQMLAGVRGSAAL